MKRPLPSWVLALLLGVGSLQMIGALVGSPVLKAIGLATGLSPAPKVFSSVNGLETFSISISLHWLDREGLAQSLQLTPEVASGLEGPYNRRNVYGAALAYGPVLNDSEIGRAMLHAVFEYALGPDKRLMRELGVEPASVAGEVTVRWKPKHGGEGLQLMYVTGEHGP